jgi:predicted GH43/DUF377 family glycosyl hydrolase
MKLTRTNISLKADYKRVLARPFVIGDEKRLRKIFDRVLKLSDNERSQELKGILGSFEARHKNIKRTFSKRYEDMAAKVKPKGKISEESKLLIGAYFTMEYSIEAAALFNPSMVWHPDQKNLPAGSKRFIISLRSTGEGHISSITFRSGVVDAANNITLDAPTKYLCQPELIEDFGNSDYAVTFASDTELSERVIFPYAPAETNGVEDARFVEFKEDDGSVKYYSTYTAYDGHAITPRILETTDFVKFKISTLKGSEVANKGFALFPRKVNGKYIMLSRQDNENNYIMFSDDLYTWNNKKMIMEPEHPWDFIQLGNCGSPIETEAGWLVLSHGVGAMRKYSIGAFLLDKNNTEKVIGNLMQPLISPNEDEREGYVPNVVYSCGGAVKDGDLIIPYAMSDYASSFAKVNLNDLIKELTKGN